MTDTPTTPEPQDPAQAPEAPEPAAPASEPQEPAPEADDKAPKGEAALRKRAQAAEAERDTLRGQLDAAHRQMVDSMTAAHLVDPGEFWKNDGAVSLTEDGTLDVEAVQGALTDLLAAKPYLSKPRIPKPNPAQGSSANGAAVSGEGQRMGAIFDRG